MSLFEFSEAGLDIPSMPPSQRLFSLGFGFRTHAIEVCLSSPSGLFFFRKLLWHTCHQVSTTTYHYASFPDADAFDEHRSSMPSPAESYSRPTNSSGSIGEECALKAEMIVVAAHTRTGDKANVCSVIRWIGRGAMLRFESQRNMSREGERDIACHCRTHVF